MFKKTFLLLTLLAVLVASALAGPKENDLIRALRDFRDAVNTKDAPRLLSEVSTSATEYNQAERDSLLADLKAFHAGLPQLVHLSFNVREYQITENSASATVQFYFVAAKDTPRIAPYMTKASILVVNFAPDASGVWRVSRAKEIIGQLKGLRTK